MTTFVDPPAPRRESALARRVRRRCGMLPIAGLVLAAVAIQAQTPDEFARRRLESGRVFMASQNYEEALKDFEMVIQTYPTSAVADDALLEIARYLLEIARDPAAASVRTKELLNTYPGSDSAAMGQVLEGRISLATGHGADQVNAAIASFDRVPRLFPGSDAVPAALYYGAEASRIGRRPDALDRFTQLAVRYPRSPWTARALLGAALSLTASGQPLRAMEQLQRVRNEFPSSREAAVALEWSTALYRLHVRAPAQPPYVFSSGVTGPGGRLRNVTDIKVDRENHLLVATGTGVTVFDGRGTAVRSLSAPQLRTLFIDALGRTIITHETGAVRTVGGSDVVLATPGSDGRPRPVRIEAAVTTSFGEHIVASRDHKGLLRFAASGQPAGELTQQVVAKRLAISDLDDVAALDPDAKAVAVIDREGRILARFPERGTGYQFRRPVDLAFDRLGYLYVLDRAAVFVFAPHTQRLVATFAPAERVAGAFGNPEVLALDAAARLYVFDSRSNQVQVYR